jgi:putative nucleotidyltransferase with HDIG domain
MEYLSASAVRRDSHAEQTLQLLLDRLRCSITLAKPVGLATWAQREAERYGIDGVIDLANAAACAILEASDARGVDRQEVQTYLDVLSQEIERAAESAQGQMLADSSASEATASLLAMLAERDGETCYHSKATAQWASRLAAEMGMTASEQEFIALCALLHDVGKVATPERVLLKPAPLTDDEWKIMREHPIAGARILNQIPSLQRCAVVVRAHHERFDGAGYPDGLAGINIPIEARVVAVADGFHAMISERPYRKPIAPREALLILEEGSGSQWDRDVVDAMLAMLRRGKQSPSDTTSVSSA